VSRTQTQRGTTSRAARTGVRHLTIENVSPSVDGGRYPAKRALGDVCVIGADVFKDGHDLLAARVRYRAPGDVRWRSQRLTYDVDADRWTARIALGELGLWWFAIDAWTDEFGTWRAALGKKVAAKQDVSVELVEGAELVERAASDAAPADIARQLDEWGARLRDERLSVADRERLALDPLLAELMDAYATPRDRTTSERAYPLIVDRRLAAFSAWYELFPRSTAKEPGRHGTFRDAEQVLPRIAALGFDVVYLPPIHPIGRTFRKGRNNTLEPEPGDVGSPWAIGNEHGGHTAIEPQLGTVDDFARFIGRARALGLDVALDYALQCSPDHPWVREHPDWFHIRPDGSIQYAENPPKKYQDIYPLNFWTADREGLWTACRDILLYWLERGVRTFRVDNPHTKPFAFWEWVIADVRRRHPDVVFLSEAFTRPKKLLNLAKLGFDQSYTYFTWKNTKWELGDWMREFSTPDVLEYYRGNFFTNTPDILTEYLQKGGRAAFRARLVLAGTLSPVYGIYSGFELAEHVAARPKSEEYLDSEKYQLRQRDFAVSGALDAEIHRLNMLRREHAALQRADNLTILETDHEDLFAFWKAAPAVGEADLFVVVNLDPKRPHHGKVRVPFWKLGLDLHEEWVVQDALSGSWHRWRGEWQRVALDPAHEAACIFRHYRERSSQHGEGAR
jgi:starch synthase (maltosyl-transferring)